MNELHVITDMQFGSCGKGLFSGFLAEKIQPDTIVTAWAPNAGHTFIGRDGVPKVNVALPIGIIEDSVRTVLIGPGSVINPALLLAEAEAYAADGVRPNIYIHPNAAVVDEQHRRDEASYGFAIGSTMKGVGEAMIQKIRRNPNDDNTAKCALAETPLRDHVVSMYEYNRLVDKSRVMLLEGAQGFSLSINQGFYPYTTSRDCTVHQLLSDCGLPRTGWVHVYGVCRTYPIRVANRYNTDGEQVGTSGPGYFDQKEIEWSDLGLAPELTTVTRLPRRIFTWSDEQVEQAIRMNGIRDVFLNFANYHQGANGRDIESIIESIEKCGASVKWLGYGPAITDIKERFPHVSHFGPVAGGR